MTTPKKRKDTPTDFTVERETWCRGGKGAKNPLLLTEDGYRCCLGFWGRACGVSDRRMLGKGMPRMVLGWKGRPIDDDVLQEIAGDNDSTLITDAERERRLRAEFKNHGITIRFTGKRT